MKAAGDNLADCQGLAGPEMCGVCLRQRKPWIDVESSVLGGRPGHHRSGVALLTGHHPVGGLDLVLSEGVEGSLELSTPNSMEEPSDERVASHSGETGEGLSQDGLGGLSGTSGIVPREGLFGRPDDASRDASVCVQEESLCEGGEGRLASDPLRVGGRPTRCTHPVIQPSGSRFSGLEIEEAAGACFSEVDQCSPITGGDCSASEDMVFGSSRHADPELEVGSDTMTPTWRRRMRRKRFGNLVAHARYLQYLFRRTRNVRPGCWSRGGMRGLLVYRVPPVFACRGGSALAGESSFIMQQRRAREATAWYQNYVALLRRLRSGRTPTAVVGFCGQGGVSEGIKRANGASHGQDLRDQPRYRRWFSDSTFSMGDSTDVTRLREIKKVTGAFLCAHSPPCKEDSTARQRGVASEPSLITETRDVLREVGGLHVIENVLGAGGKMSSESLGASATAAKAPPPACE